MLAAVYQSRLDLQIRLLSCESHQPKTQAATYHLGWLCPQ